MGNVAVAGPQTVVVGAGAVHLPGQRWWQLQGVEHVGHLVSQVMGAENVLVHVEALDKLGLPAQLPAKREHRFTMAALDDGWEVQALDDVPAGHLGRWLKVRRGGPWCSVVVLPYDAADKREAITAPWCFEDRLEDVVRGLARFELTVGMPWRDSWGRTVERLILSTHPRERGGVTMDRTPLTPEPAELGTLERAFNWRRPLTDAERAAGYVHAFDQNAQYLAAWQTVELGFGEPVHHSPTVFDPKAVGLWRLAGGMATVLASVDYGQLPAPFDVDGEWFTTPTMTRMVEVLDDVPPVVEAWIWPAHSRWLRGAGEQLRDARAQLSTEARMDRAAAVALSAVKRLYAGETGRFNMNRPGREHSQWRRPEWGHLIRAQARVNLHRRLAKLSAAPFSIATDGLLFCADEPDPRVFAQSIGTEAHPLGLPLGNGLGHFSIEGTWKLTPERVDELDAARTPAALAKLLTSWGAS